MPIDWEEWQKNRQRNKRSDRSGQNGDGGDGDRGGRGGGGFPFNVNLDALRNLKPGPGGRRLFLFIPLALILAWGASGLFVVESYEVGLVKRFGEYRRTVTQGLNYHLPWPLESAVKVNTSKIEKLEIGGLGDSRASNSMMLTGDENIVDIKFAVQYRVASPIDYAFKVAEPTKTIEEAATSAMREVIGRNSIDDALTDKRQQIQEDTVQTLQAMLDKYQVGFLVLSVNLQDVQVPQDVRQAFRDVTSAKEESVRSVNEAQGYVNRIKPAAEAEAVTIKAQAQGYAARRVNQAQGETARFLALLAEYQKMPDITRARLALETMDKIMPLTEKYVIAGQAGQSILPHLGLSSAPAAKPRNEEAAQ